MMADVTAAGAMLPAAAVAGIRLSAAIARGMVVAPVGYEHCNIFDGTPGYCEMQPVMAC